MKVLRILPKQTYIRYNYVRHFSHRQNFGFLFDIDGVIIRGKNVLPLVPESFKRLVNSSNEFKIPTLFVTNSGNELKSEKAADLTRWLGIPVSENQIVLSYTPLSELREYHDKRVLISGQGNVQKTASELGFRNIVTMEELVYNFPSLDYVNKEKRVPLNGPKDKNFKKIDGIILLNEPTNWETSLQLILDLLMTDGIPAEMPNRNPYPHIFIIACNMDLLWVSHAPLPRYGHGAFLHCLESLYNKVTGKEMIYTNLIGKPSLTTYCYAKNKLIEHAKSIGICNEINTIYAVGDNINTDIYGANLYNMFLESFKKFDHSKFAISESMWKVLQKQHESNSCHVKKCVSILVETGVHQSNSTFCSHHSPRDFIFREETVYRPAIIAKDVCHAIDIVLKNEES